MGGEVCNSYHVSVLYCYLIEAPLEDHVCNLVSIILLSIAIVVAFTDSTAAWIIDSGATCHMCNDEYLFMD